jgi:hypothetical protein
METTLGLFAATRAATPTLLYHDASIQSTTPVSAMEILQWITEQTSRNPNQSGEEDNAAEKINSGKLGFT